MLQRFSKPAFQHWWVTMSNSSWPANLICYHAWKQTVEHINSSDPVACSIWSSNGSFLWDTCNPRTHGCCFLSITITSILSCGYVYAEGYNCRVIKGSQLSLQLPPRARLHLEGGVGGATKRPREGGGTKSEKATRQKEACIKMLKWNSEYSSSHSSKSQNSHILLALCR